MTQETLQTLFKISLLASHKDLKIENKLTNIIFFPEDWKHHKILLGNTSLWPFHMSSAKSCTFFLFKYGFQHISHLKLQSASSCPIAIYIIIAWALYYVYYTAVNKPKSFFLKKKVA